MAADD